jgi:hypothetical protein
MSQFLYLYRMTAAARQEAMGTPERAQQSMQRWMKWMSDLEAKGHLKDRGQPLERTGKVVRGQKAVTDGAPTPKPRTWSAGSPLLKRATSIKPWSSRTDVQSSMAVVPWKCDL